MSTFPSLTDDELCIIKYSNIGNLDFFVFLLWRALAGDRARGTVQDALSTATNWSTTTQVELRVVFLVRHGGLRQYSVLHAGAGEPWIELEPGFSWFRSAARPVGGCFPNGCHSVTVCVRACVRVVPLRRFEK